MAFVTATSVRDCSMDVCTRPGEVSVQGACRHEHVLSAVYCGVCWATVRLLASEGAAHCGPCREAACYTCPLTVRESPTAATTTAATTTTKDI